MSHTQCVTAIFYDAIGSDVGSMGKVGNEGCGDLFRENPEMKQVHSVASAAALIKRVAAVSN